MTSYERYSVLLAVMQVLVSGLGFIVVAWSLRVLIKTLDAQSSAGVAARQLEFDKTILTYPVLGTGKCPADGIHYLTTHRFALGPGNWLS